MTRLGAGAALVLLASLAIAPRAHAGAAKSAEPVAVRKVVIAAFGGKSGTQARNIALEIVAGRQDRTDFTVIGHDDVEVVAKRLGVPSTTQAGRAQIAEEMGVDLWLDGELSGGEGELRLSDKSGAQIARLPVSEHNAEVAVRVLRDKIWDWAGALLSESERIARKLQAEHDRALEKVAAREQLLVHARQLVVEREQQRLTHLEAAKALAKQKVEARDEELAHQAELVRDRKLAEAREQQRQQEEAQRALAQEAERRRLAEQAALQQQQLQQQQLQLQQQQQQQQQAAAGSWQQPQNQWQQPQPAASTWQPPQNQWQQPAAQPAASAWQPQQPYAQPQPSQWQQPQAPAQDSVPVVDGISPETREWLARKRRERAAAAGR